MHYLIILMNLETDNGRGFFLIFFLVDFQFEDTFLTSIFVYKD